MTQPSPESTSPTTTSAKLSPEAALAALQAKHNAAIAEIEALRSNPWRVIVYDKTKSFHPALADAIVEAVEVEIEIRPTVRIDSVKFRSAFETDLLRGSLDITSKETADVKSLKTAIDVFWTGSPLGVSQANVLAWMGLGPQKEPSAVEFIDRAVALIEATRAQVNVSRNARAIHRLTPDETDFVDVSKEAINLLKQAKEAARRSEIALSCPICALPDPLLGKVNDLLSNTPNTDDTNRVASEVKGWLKIEHAVDLDHKVLVAHRSRHL